MNRLILAAITITIITAGAIVTHSDTLPRAETEPGKLADPFQQNRRQQQRLTATWGSLWNGEYRLGR